MREIVIPPGDAGGEEQQKTFQRKTYTVQFDYTTSRLGLSIYHNGPRSILVPQVPFLEVAMEGTYCRVAVASSASSSVSVSVSGSNAKRGKIRTFSRRSRARLMRLLAKLDKSKMPCFITLTYPSSFPSAKVAKGDLKAFLKRLMRLSPQAAGVWKLEFQERGAPHFHLLVWGLNKFALQFLREWVSRAWYEVVKSRDEKHLKAGTNVQRVRSWKSVMGYASKYLGKDVEVPEQEPGRFWGTFNRKALPWSEILRVCLSWRVFYKLRRLLARVSRRSLRGFEREWGFSAFIEPGDVLRFLAVLEKG